MEGHELIYKSASCGRNIDYEEYHRNRDIANRENNKLRDYIIRSGNSRFRCELCKDVYSTDELEIHHRVRIADGGSPFRDNMMCLCEGCHDRIHNRKRNKNKEDYMMKVDVYIGSDVDSNVADVIYSLNNKINEYLSSDTYKDINSKVVSLIEHAENEIIKELRR